MRVILVGEGRAILFLAQAFRAKGHHLTVIDPLPEECVRLVSRLDATVVNGDGSDPVVLEDAGARSADIVLAATLRDADNLVVCQLARSRFGVPRSVALVNDPDNQRLFGELGFEALSTSLTIASLIEQRASISEITDLIPAVGGRVTISEVRVGDDFALDGWRLRDIGLPHDALVAVLTRGSETLVPRGDTQLHSGDHLLLIALSGSMERALRLLTGQVPADRS